MKSFKDLKITFIGSGNMAEALVSGLIRSGHIAENIFTTDVDTTRLEMMQKNYAVQVSTDNGLAVSNADVVLLAVKPQKMVDVIPLITHRIAETTTVISIAAGTSMDSLRSWLGQKGKNLIRVMPNTPALVGEGMSVMYSDVEDVLHRDRASYILGASGEIAWVDIESQLHAVTALSGSGPAYMFLIAESMQAMGVSSGLSDELAHKLAAQTILGAGKMLIESGRSATDLKNQVTSPGGTTLAALDEMYEHALPTALRRGMAAAIKRSQELV